MIVICVFVFVTMGKLMQNSENLTKKVNKTCLSQTFSDAIKLDQQALIIMKKSFDEDFYDNAQSAITAATISFLNIAESYAASGYFILANIQYKEAVRFLQTAIVSSNINDKQYSLIMRTITRIRCEWELFKQSHIISSPINS